MNTNKPTERKPYVAPNLVQHGGAVEKTRGGYGSYSEYYFWRRDPICCTL